MAQVKFNHDYKKETRTELVEVEFESAQFAGKSKFTAAQDCHDSVGNRLQLDPVELLVESSNLKQQQTLQYGLSLESHFQ